MLITWVTLDEEKRARERERERKRERVRGLVYNPGADATDPWGRRRRSVQID